MDAGLVRAASRMTYTVKCDAVTRALESSTRASDFDTRAIALESSPVYVAFNLRLRDRPATDG